MVGVARHISWSRRLQPQSKPGTGRVAISIGEYYPYRVSPGFKNSFILRLIGSLLGGPAGRLAVRLRKSLYARKPSRTERILLFSFHGIGDAILQTPEITLIRQQYPEAHITMVVRDNIKEVFRNNPHIDEFIPYTHGGHAGVSTKEFFRTLRLILFNRKFDLALLDSSGSKLRGHLLAILMGVRYIVTDGMDKPDRNFLVDESVFYDESLHQAERNASILRNSLTDFDDSCLDGLKLFVPTSERDEDKARKFLRSNGIEDSNKVIALHPGSGDILGIHKRWPAEQYLELVDQVREYFPGHPILVLKGPNESGIDYRGFAEKNCLIIENFSLLEVAALLQRVAVFVGNDSGISHLAASQDTPCVVIFGPTDENLIRPCGQNVSVVSCPMDCRPCWGSSGYLRACGRRIDCLASIKSETVMEALQTYLLLQDAASGAVNPENQSSTVNRKSQID